MIPGLRRRLVDDVRRCLAQSCPLALEANIADTRDILVTVAKVVGEKETQALDFAKERPLDGDFLNIGCL